MSSSKNDARPDTLVAAYYFVADEIENTCWNEFACSEVYLHLSQQKVDDIRHDIVGIKDQKFKALDVWGKSQNLDDKAIIEKLYNLLDKFRAAATNDLQSQENASTESADSAFICTSDLKGHCLCECYLKKWKSICGSEDVVEVDCLTDKIADLVEESDSEEIKKIYTHCYSNFVEITEHCMKHKRYDLGNLIVLSKFSILRQCCDYLSTSDLLSKLQDIGICFVALAMKMFEEDWENSTRPFLYIDQLVDYMLEICRFKIGKNENVLQKNKHIIAILSAYGDMCIKTKNNAKALAVYSQLATMIKMLHGRQAKEFKTLVGCYHNIGRLYDELGQLDLAKNAINDAISVCSNAYYSKQKEKDTYLSILMAYLQYLKEKDNPGQNTNPSEIAIVSNHF